MDLCLIAMIVGVILFFVFIVFFIYLDIKKHYLITIKNTDVMTVKRGIIQALMLKGFKINDNPKETYVEQGTFTAANLIFAQEGTDVKIYRKNAVSPLGMVIVIILAFTVFIVGFILAIYSDYNSSKFAKETLLPILTDESVRGRICPDCQRPIPFDAIMCPFCGKKF
jgi:ABC-type antimicrobial peptide transport system permease subunit